MLQTWESYDPSIKTGTDYWEEILNRGTIGLLGTQQSQTEQQKTQDFLDRYFDHPDRWARECVTWPAGHHLIGYQAEAMQQLVQHGRHALRGPRGTGKTTVSALLLLWFATTRSAAGLDWKCVTTANYWRQLQRFLWPEIHKWQRRLKWETAIPRGPLIEKNELLTLSLHLPPNGDAFAVASDDNESMEGAHATQVFYLFDESKIIPPPSWDSVEGAASNTQQQPLNTQSDNIGERPPQAYWFAGSIPGDTSGRFYDICRHAPGYEDWSRQHVTMAEVIAAQQMTEAWANARKLQWGETSELYQNHVLGEFAESASDSLIPLAWIEAAQARWHDQVAESQKEAIIQIGVDVGRGGDKTVLAPRTEKTVMELIRTQIADTMDTAGRINAKLESHPHARAMIDLPGVGSGVYDRVREVHPKQVDAFNPGTKTEFRDRTGEFAFTNTRSAALWNLRELLDPQYAEEIALPPDENITGDLTGYRYRFVSGGKIQIESKRTVFEEGEQTLVHRLGRSPDDGDAIVMAFWREVEVPPARGGGHRVKGW